MKKTRLAILTVHKFDCCNLYNPAKKQISEKQLPISIQKIYIEDILIKWTDSGIHLIVNNKNIINQFDAFLFRIDLQRDLSKIYVIAKTLKNNNKICINSTFANNTTYSDKLSILNLLQQLNLKHPTTYFSDSKILFKKQCTSLQFPFVIKDPYGWRGEKVYLIKNSKQLDEITSSFPNHGFITQKYLPINYDIRILTIGFKALGAMKRIAPQNDFRSNLASGGTFEKIHLTDEFKNIAENIARHIKSEMLGIDLFIYNNKIYVNEIETCPGFTGFAQATGLSPLSELLQYIHEQNNL